MTIRSRTILTLLAAALLAPAGFAEFVCGIEMPAQTPVAPCVEAALREIGVGYINYYVKPWIGHSDEQAAVVNDAMIALAERLEIPFSLACFVVDPPEACIQAARRAKVPFRGLVCDELAHCRLLNPHEGVPTMLEGAEVNSLQDAYEAALTGYQALHDTYAALDAPVVATHVFPVLHHVAARAGCIPCPKIQKEFYSSISLAIGLGAALQYGRGLWVDCDLWYYDLVPGHPPEEFWCNLLLAYWLGADVLYVEGCGHNLTTPGSQGIPFSLMTPVTPELFQLTAHGETLRRFLREYVPNHPRSWTFRDVQPTAAVIRFPDSDYGQRFMQASHLPDDNPMKRWHAGLYGSPDLPCTPDTEAWFGLWKLLTLGACGTDGLSFFTCTAATRGYQRPVQEGVVQSLYSRPLQAESHRFFVPLNNVVVFDHLVGYDRLRGVPLLLLTGVTISDATMAAVRRCVDEGATAVIWGNLARTLGFEDYAGGVEVRPQGAGKFVLTDVFCTNAVFQQIWPHMGKPDEIRYVFGKHTVVLKRVTDNDVDVRIEKR